MWKVRRLFQQKVNVFVNKRKVAINFETTKNYLILLSVPSKYCFLQNNSLEKHPHPNARLSRGEVLQSRYIIASEMDRINCDVMNRHPVPEKPAFFQLYPHEEIRLYKGL